MNAKRWILRPLIITAVLVFTASSAAPAAPWHGRGVYWGPYWGFGVGWGWPYAGWYGPGYYPRPYGPLRVVPRDAAAVELHLHPRKATVKVDGALVGQARDFNDYYDPLWLGPGRHALEFSYSGYMTLRIGLEVRRGGHYTVRESLEEGTGDDPRSETVVPAPREPAKPGPARLRVHVDPEDAALYLDGEFVGRVDDASHPGGVFVVTPGTHHLEAVRPGFKSQEVDVDAQPGQPVKVEVVLEPEGSA